MPQFTSYSKSFGALTIGMWEFMTGVKVNGVRTGEVLPFPDEVEFSKDSLYYPHSLGATEFWIKNTSTYPLDLDTISTNSIFGYQIIVKNNESFFLYLFNKYPRDSRFDTLKFTIPPNDSLMFQFIGVNLCPICFKNITDEFFTDTLNFLFSYEPWTVYTRYYFEKEMPISGYGRPSHVENNLTVKTFALYQNYPNPFNSSTKIKYKIPNVETRPAAAGKHGVSLYTTLKVFDILGREVATLVNEEKSPGEHEVQFNFDNSHTSSGIYFYELKVGENRITKKMSLIR